MTKLLDIIRKLDKTAILFTFIDSNPEPDHDPEPDTDPDEEMHGAISGEYAEPCM